MDLGVLQIWYTTHFKAYSKKWSSESQNGMILFKENLLQSAMFFKAEILDNFKSETKLSY